MLSQTQTQESKLPVMNQSLEGTGTYQQLEELLAALPQIQACISNSQTLVETHFSQESKTKIESMTWLELQTSLVDLEATLHESVKQAQMLLINSDIRFAQANTQTLTNWTLEAKRSDLLRLFRHCKMNEDLSDIIDEALSQNATAIASILNPQLRLDLMALLEEQVKDFSALSKRVGTALNAQEQEAVLHKLLGDPKDELMFDVFSSGLMAMSDLELSLAAIAAYTVLYA